METLNIIILLVCTAIPVIIYFWPKRKIKKTTSNVVNQAPPIPAILTPTPAHGAGHGTPKKKPGFLSIIMQIIIVLILIALLVGAIFWIVNVLREVIKPSPQYTTVLVEVRRKTINLNSKFNDTDSVHMQYGQKCEFKDATVSFCAQNGNRETVCGETYTCPDLPSGPGNEHIWFKSRTKYTGTIVIVIFERRRRLVR